MSDREFYDYAVLPAVGIAVFLLLCLACRLAGWSPVRFVRGTLRHGRHQHYQPWRLSWWLRDAAEDTGRWLIQYARELLRSNGLDDDPGAGWQMRGEHGPELIDLPDDDAATHRWLQHDLRQDEPPVPPRDAVDDLTEEFAAALNVPESGQSYGLTPGPRQPHVLYGFSRHLSGDRDWTPRAIPPRVEPGRQPAYTTQQHWPPDTAYLRTEQGAWQLGGWTASHQPADQPAWAVVRPVREIRAVDDTIAEPPVRAPWFGFVEWALTAPIEDIHDYLAVTA